MKRYQSNNVKRLMVLFVIMISILLLACACSDSTDKNDKGKEAVAEKVTLVPTDNKEQETPIATDNGETAVPTSDTAEETIETKTPAATQTAQSLATSTATSKVTANVNSSPTKNTTTKASATPKITATAKATITPKASATSKVTATAKATPSATKTPKPVVTVVPTNNATTAKPVSTPVKYQIINAAKDKNYSSLQPTVIKVSDINTEIYNNNGAVSQNADGNIYIKAAGEYDFSGKMINRSIIVQATDTEKVYINLKGIEISTNIDSPISILSADKVEVSANRGTTNTIKYTKTQNLIDDATGGAINSECDLVIKGKGNLNIVTNYNNGISTKDDLEIKNLTLNVVSNNHSLKGNDSVTIVSGNINITSENGNGIDTKNSDVSTSGKQRGNVTISSGTIKIKAKNDGINAAYNAIVSSGTLVIEAGDYAIDAKNSITLSPNVKFTDNSTMGCNSAF